MNQSRQASSTASCRVPYDWRLGSIHFRDMDETDMSDFVYMSAAHGASGVLTIAAEGTCDDVGVAKTRAFVEAAKRTKQFLDDGGPRPEILQWVSAKGKGRFWSHWP